MADKPETLPEPDFYLDGEPYYTASTLREAIKGARKLPSDYVDAAGILASDSPAVVVQKLDAACKLLEDEQ